MKNIDCLKKLRKNLELLLIAGVLSISSTGCNNKENNDTSESLVEITTTENASNEEIDYGIYNFDRLCLTIDSNKNLSEEEKDFIKKMRFVFDENLEYMDIETIKIRLLTLKIEYVNTKNEDNSFIGGIYSRSKNTITMYDSTNINDVEIECFIHELLHVLQNNNNRDFTIELSNEFFAREITRQLYDDGIITDEQINRIHGNDYYPGIQNIYGRGYNSYMPLYYSLAELIDEKSLRSYQFSCDINSLINGVCDCNGKMLPKENMELFIKTLNDSRKINEKTNTYDIASSFEEGDIISECANYLNYYYENKLGYNIKDDIKVSIHYYNKSALFYGSYNPYNTEEFKILNDLLIEEAKKQLGDDATKVGVNVIVTPRTYLSNNHPNPYYTFNSPSDVTIEIDNNFSNELKKRFKNQEKSLVLEP